MESATLHTADIARKLDLVLRTPLADGLTAMPFLGAVFCLLKHRLRAVSMPRAAAVYVLEGKKTLFRGEERLLLEAGRMFVLPSQMEVGIDNEPDPRTGRYLALCLSLPDEMLARVATAIAPGHAPATSLAAFGVAVDAPLTLAVGHLLDMAAACAGNQRLLSLCLEAVVVLVAGRTTAMPLLWDATTTWRSRVACLVGQEPSRNWSTRDVAGRLALGERSLRRCLEAEGTSFRQVLQDVRLSAALALLQTGRMSVGEAAYLCGYNSASRFAGRFRERFGANPSDILRYAAVSG